MKAAQITNYGESDVVQIVNDANKPVSIPASVVIEVHAASINPFDLAVRQGYVRQMAELKFPAILGGDFAGTVSKVGEGVSDFKIGDKVYGQAGALSGQGSFAEFTIAKASSVALKPSTIDFTTAAALPLVCNSAYQSLVDTIDLKPDQKILIHGGAGGIGSIAIQLAKHLGAYVSTTASSDDANYVRSIGADETIDYKSQDFSQLLKDYDAVFDNIGGDTNIKSYQVLKPGGALVSMVDPPNSDLVSKHQIKYTHQYTQSTTESLSEIARLVDGGILKPQVDKQFSLEQLAQAMDYQQNGHPRGKVVLKIK